MSAPRLPRQSEAERPRSCKSKRVAVDTLLLRPSRRLREKTTLYGDHVVPSPADAEEGLVPEALASGCSQAQPDALKQAWGRPAREVPHGVATPMKAATFRPAAGQKRKWQLSISPPPEAPEPLSPLVGGVEEWAAQCASKQKEDLYKSAARLLGLEACGGLVAGRSPLARDAQAAPSPSPRVVDLTGGDAMLGVLDLTGTCLAEEPGSSAARAATSKEAEVSPAAKARQALVARSVSAAVRDEMAREPRLVDLSTGMVHTLPRDGLVALGHCAECDIVVAHPAVSGRHCILLCAEGSVEVEDLDSGDTFVNEIRVPKGELLPQRISLTREDTLALGTLDGPKLLFLSGRGPRVAMLGGA